MVRPVGFDVELAPTEFVTALNRADAGSYEAFAVGWSGRVDPDGNIYGFVHSKGTLNNAGFVEPAARPGARQRAQGDDGQGAGDALLGRDADRAPRSAR